MRRRRSSRIIERLARADVGARPKSRTPRDPQTSRDLKADLLGAVERGELVLHYQPIVELRSGECRRVEALVRWRHRRQGLILPGELLPLAEASGQLPAIGRWVIAEAARQWADWRAQGLPLGVGVNLASPELVASGVVDDALDSLLKYDVEPGAFTCEVDAATFLAGDMAPRLALRRLAVAGARVSLDNSSAADVPGRSLAPDLDEIKLSRSLVRRALAEPSGAADVRALVELARDLQLMVVAVGVEDRATRDLVAALGCDLAQGYWVSRPLLAHRIAPWRRWAVGLALGGALALASHGSAAKAASSEAVPRAPAAVRGFLPTICALDLPTAHAPSRSVTAQSSIDDLKRRTGVDFVVQPAAHADVYVQASVPATKRARIARAVDRDMKQLAQDYGRDFAGRPAIYVFASRSSFALGLQQLFGVRGTDAGLLAAANGGVTLPRQGAIVINLQNVPNDGDLAIVRHELTHAIVHETIGPQGTIPAWVDEGLATLEERTLRADDDGGARDAAVTLTLLAEGRASLDTLESPSEWAQRNAALDGQGYPLAAEAVRLLRERVSAAGLVRILEATGGGTTFGAAYADAAGESIGDFERAFPARLAAERGAPNIVARAAEGGVRWTLVGLAPESIVNVTIEGAGYRLEYQVTTDRYGSYDAMFGATAPPGEYSIRASGPGGTAVGVLHTDT